MLGNFGDLPVVVFLEHWVYIYIYIYTQNPLRFFVIFTNAPFFVVCNNTYQTTRISLVHVFGPWEVNQVNQDAGRVDVA